MFRRLFWFAAGASTGVWATMRVNRALRRLTPEGLAAAAAAIAADRATEVGARARRFALDVRTGMTEREAELGRALGIAPPDARAALPGRRPAPRRKPAPYRLTPYKKLTSSKLQPYKKKEGH